MRGGGYWRSPETGTVQWKLKPQSEELFVGRWNQRRDPIKANNVTEGREKGEKYPGLTP